MTSTEPDHQVVVVGDGPAGRALTSALRRRGADVVCVGRDMPWSATYGTWVDDVIGVAGLPDVVDCLAASRPGEVFTAADGHRITGRAYGSFDNARLRERLTDREVFRAEVIAIRETPGASVEVETTDGALSAQLVIDARGWTGDATEDPTVAQQTAFGVVLETRPAVGGEGNIVMDWRPAGPRALRDGSPPTFLYVLDLGDGRWLAEETALAAAPPVGVDVLRRRLVERLGDDVVATALRTEEVLIPMRPGVPALTGAAVPFGARAGYVHPATGYSVAASMRAADRVAASIVAALGADLGGRRGSAALRAVVWQAVWPTAARRARALHDIGSSLLATLEPDDQDAFFARFFALDEQRWSAYLRIDASARDVATAMWGVFRGSPWSVRRQLVGAVPRTLRRRVRRAGG